MEIKNVYTQAFPASRFIGLKYGDDDRVGGGFGAKWGEAFSTGLFDRIQAAGAAFGDAFPDMDAFIGLMRCKDGEPFEYWIGKFMPADTKVPDGLASTDFPAATLGVGWVYGNDDAGEIYCHEPEVDAKLKEAGHPSVNDDKGACWFFERYQCPRYTTPDEAGNVILDICFFVK